MYEQTASTNIATLDQTSLASFQQYIVGLKLGMKRQYDRYVNRDLSRQNSRGVFKRNVIDVLDEAYDMFLQHLTQLPSDTIQSSTAEILDAFGGFTDELVQFALQKHRSSCALSNFPEEHNPDKDYIAQVLEEAQKRWITFSMQLEGIMHSKMTPQQIPVTSM